MAYMLSRTTWLMASALTFLTPHVQALELDGIHLANATQVSGHPLVLNGAGISKRWFFNVYAMGLYLPDRRDHRTVLDGNAARRMQITLMRPISGSEFEEAIASRLSRYAEKAGQAQISAQMNLVVKAIARQPNGLRKGDVLTLDWIPGTGTRIELNGSPLLSPLSGTVFYNALLRIWLGDDPADPDLKPKLLGKLRLPPNDPCQIATGDADCSAGKVLMAADARQRDW